MADTRCANPEYQLEVDTMMLEYILYHAIDAKLKCLKSELLHKGHEESTLSGTADRLVVNFDILVSLFKHDHPNTLFSADTTFNIKILEFVLLFAQWLHRDTCDGQLLRERRLNINDRRHWLRSWIATNTSDPDCDPAIRALSPKIDPNSISVDHATDIATVDLTDLLARFLDLSAEIAEAMGVVNEAWYRLAVEFMLQCAVERVQIFDEMDVGTENIDIATERLMSAVAQCFAWGAIDLQPSMKSQSDKPDRWLTRHLEEQMFITKLFELRDTGTNGKSQNQDQIDVEMHDGNTPGDSSKKEHPSWTRLRTEYLMNAVNLVEAHTNTSSDRDKHALARQRRRRPLVAFLGELRSFVKGLWRMNMKEEMSGKPVLVQIEQGGINGMKEDEFRDFLSRVGLKIGHQNESGRGVVRWTR